MKSAEDSKEDPHKAKAEMSPFRSSSKHLTATPMRKNKSTKHKKEEDVHSTSPKSPEPTEESSIFSGNSVPWSPSEFSTQDRPEVTWDFSYNEDGKLPKNWTVKELAESLSIVQEVMRSHPLPHCVAAKCAVSSAWQPPKPKLLSKELHNVTPKPEPKSKKQLETKPPSKCVEEELDELMELLNTASCKKAEIQAKLQQTDELPKENGPGDHGVAQACDPSKCAVGNPEHKSVDAADEVDSYDELWGADDPGFIAHATQFSMDIENEMGSMLAGFNKPEVFTHDTTEKSTVGEFQEHVVFDKCEQQNQKHSSVKEKPGYFTKLHKETSGASHPSVVKFDFKDSCISSKSDESYLDMPVSYASISSKHDLSSNNSGNMDFVRSTDKKYTFSKRMNSHLSVGNILSHGSKHLVPRILNFRDTDASTSRKVQSFSGNESTGDHKTYLRKSTSAVQQSSSSLSDTKDSVLSLDSSLEMLNESMTLEPETLSWLDEIESQAYHQTKCSPEEIAQKRAAAQKRRQQKLLVNKPN